MPCIKMATPSSIARPVGEGRTVNLEMLESSVQMILDGAKLVSAKPTWPASGRRFCRQRFEQYRTYVQDFAHFFRQENRLPQVAHSLLGRCCFLIGPVHENL
jgi:hypothetical protein